MLKTKFQKLHELIRGIDFSSMNVQTEKKSDIHEIARKNSRFLGTEFDRTFKIIISQLNHSFSSDLVNLSLKTDLDTNENLFYPVRISKGFKNDFIENFSVNSYLENYNFQSKFKYGIMNKNEINYCQSYLSNLFETINFEKFQAKKRLLTNVKFHHEIYGAGGNSGAIDLIIDDKIIDIKTDLKIGATPKKYISQLLYYYFFCTFLFSSNQQFKKIKINKICLYYAHFDKLIEFNLRDKLGDEKKLLSIFQNELIFGNNRIRETIYNAVINKKFDDKFFMDFENKLTLNNIKMYVHEMNQWDKLDKKV